MIQELGSCNYTTLTFASSPQGGLFYLAITVAVCFSIISFLFCGSVLLPLWVWLVLFPIALFWTAYGISPLCFPMIPPQLPRDLVLGITRLIPSEMEIPRFLVSEECNIRGVVADQRLSPDADQKRCFKKCTDDPFLMVGWQDTLAWWLCDLSPSLCRAVADRYFRGGDFATSAAYFADVIAFSEIDPEFVAAHRLCAAMTSHYLVFALAAAAVAIIVLPSVIVAIAEIFTGAISLLFSASGAQMLIMHENDDHIISNE